MSEHVGYSEPFYETEYGVFVDRRGAGLGVTLIWTTRSLSVAREHVERAARESDYAIFIRERTVIYTPWSTIDTENAEDQQ